MNQYSTKAYNFVKNNLSSIVPNYQAYDYIGCGGSVARGEAREGSDIDLLCIGKNIAEYQKEFFMSEFPVECHFVPLNYIKYNFNSLIPICNFTKYDLISNDKIRGAKHCRVIKKTSDEMSLITSSWREVKKIVDSIELYSNDDNMVFNFKKIIKNVKFNKGKFIEILNSSLEHISDIEKFILLFKARMMVEKNVFSKVYWIDSYLQSFEKSERENIISGIKIDQKIISELGQYIKDLLSKMPQIYSAINCKFCKTEMRNCNIYRCIYDYYQDYIKANKNGFKYAEIFSIYKILEYAECLFEYLGYPTLRIENLKQSFKIDKNVLTDFQHKIYARIE